MSRRTVRQAAHTRGRRARGSFERHGSPAATRTKSGPGGPILVVTAADDPFGRYYGEILRAEGLNAFTVKTSRRSTRPRSPATGSSSSPRPRLSDAQAAMLATWVNGGGNLIAMRPDARLAGLLGLGAQRAPLADAYIKVNTASSPGRRHHRATRCSSTARPTAGRRRRDAPWRRSTRAPAPARRSPAVTLRSVGSAAARPPPSPTTSRARSLHPPGQPRLGGPGARRRDDPDPLRRPLLRRRD